MDESELCKGVPLSSNKEDLKWCKTASMWTVPDNWTPMVITTSDFATDGSNKLNYLYVL